MSEMSDTSTSCSAGWLAPELPEGGCWPRPKISCVPLPLMP